MRKTVLAFGLLTTIGAAAQTTVSFEDLALAPETYYSGSDEAGHFVSNGLIFSNVYDNMYNYWSAGWIYSNTTDVSTAGYLNQSSAYTGSGADGSANYAVAYGADLDFGTAVVVGGADFTNTTYAALSMLNGDAYGKVFGSPNNALGQPDGTNGEDYFRLLIIGSDVNGMAVDTVIFYLADYRFSDNSQDYILNTWETVDLTGLGEIRYLDFKLESSDRSGEYINTPAYFAMDNLRFGTVSIAEHAAARFALFPNPVSDKVTIESEAGTLTVRTNAGALVHSEKTFGLSSIATESWNSGFYIVELANATGVTRSTLVKN
jgi:hypothetical protein